ncbi:MAG: alpha/beta hydrolase [Mycobacterium sp.]|nr:alpha/beta hydrolase [Mycobacterium sp.]
MATGTARNGAVELAYQTTGDPAGTPALLLCGNAMQQIQWPAAVLGGLVERGFQVARFDNRDCGRSTHCAELPTYTLRDMADDAVAVLDALGWTSAHLVGVSLGGMIAQVMAVHRASRVRSLTSISSAPGWGMRISRPRLRTAIKAIALGRKAGKGREAAIESAVQLYRLIGSPDYPLNEPWVREVVGRAYDIAHDPAGDLRQLNAIKASGDRRRELARVTAPTLIVHGENDPLQSIKAGRATTAAIPGARLITLPRAGHLTPDTLWPTILDEISALANRVVSP